MCALLLAYTVTERGAVSVDRAGAGSGESSAPMARGGRQLSSAYSAIENERQEPVGLSDEQEILEPGPAELRLRVPKSSRRACSLSVRG